MKLIAIGDLHGRTDWMQIVRDNEFDKVVFIGDYFDTHEDITPEQQKSNFENIISYKKDNINKAILLFGNHDYHYLKSVDETYSGFQKMHRADIAEMLHKALDADLMQMCLIDNNFIFSHAGITKTWLNNVGYDWTKHLETFVNDLFKFKPLAFRFTSGVNRSPYGDDVCQSPIWVRPKSLLTNCLDDYIQVVGHTTKEQMEIIDDKIILIDTIRTSGEFLSINNKEISFLTLNKQSLWKKKTSNRNKLNK